MNNIKIAHITSLHYRFDTRIFHRECIGLSNNGFNVSLIVNDGKPNETRNGINIYSVRKIKKTILRKLISPILIFIKILKIKPNIIQFHDPELIPLGLFIKLILKKEVIYDVHENFLSYDKNKLYHKYIILQNKLAGKYLKLVFAESSYSKNYPILKNHTEVLNYPDLSFFNEFEINNILNNPKDIIYIGGVNKDRGIREVIDALAVIDTKKPSLFSFFHIIGSIRSDKEFEYIKAGNYNSISHKIKFYGQLELEEAYRIAQNCILGVAITLPIKNYKESLSTKVFEYMAIGLPQIFSNFDIYGDLRNSQTGLSINPTIEAISDALQKILTDEVSINNFHLNSLSVRNRYSAFNEINNLIELIKTK